MEIKLMPKIHFGKLCCMLFVLLLTGCGDDDHRYRLTISPPTNGSVLVSPEAESYAYGTTVSLTANADSGYVFTGWEGDVTGTDTEITLTMDGDKSVTAHFTQGVIIELADADHGSFSIEPTVNSGDVVAFGSQFTITAIPDPGYVLDSAYKMFWLIDPGWSYYVEESSNTPYTLTTDVDDARFKLYGGTLDRYVIGAYFIPDNTWDELTEIENIQYAHPGSKSLKYDIYAPPDAFELPMVIIIHGGGWSTNNEDIMRGQARYIAQTGRYVVASIDYRLLTDLDDPAPNKVDMIQDVYGAIAHIQEHASEYGGDANRLFVTGDSAGGHLSALVPLLLPYLADGAYTGEIGSSYFTPTYIPDNLTLAQLRDRIDSSLLGVAPSYPALVSTEGLGAMDPAIEPMSIIPPATERVLPPQYLQVGSEDMTVGAEPVRQYAQQLAAAGQEVRFIEYQGAGHAYFDWKPEPGVLDVFYSTGVTALDDMIVFFDEMVSNAN